jgi:hypothetical protein
MIPLELTEASTFKPGPTGPRTKAGKDKSSRNATKTGLFAAQDYVREGEHEEYAATQAAVRAWLSPEGFLEETYAAEIVTVTWRLRRCRVLEAGFSRRSDIELYLNNNSEHEQMPIDRARAQSHLVLRRALAELRRLQTERAIRHQLNAEAFPALTDLKQLKTAVKAHDRERLQPEAESAPATEQSGPIATKPAAQAEPEVSNSFCKTDQPGEPRVQSTPRNALCPCNSGIKYKRCCGKDAPPVLCIAA